MQEIDNQGKISKKAKKKGFKSEGQDSMIHPA